MSKRDRQGVRTAADLERKYDFGKLNASQSSQKQDIAVSELTQKVDQFIASTNGNFEEVNSRIDTVISEDIYAVQEQVDSLRNECDNKYDGLSQRVRELENGDTPDGETAWEDVINKPDTFPPSEHSHTAAQVGAAPSGFGLGETNSKVVQHCDEAVLPGFYSLPGNENTGYPTEYANLKYGALAVNRRYSTVFQTITQGVITAQRYGTTSDGGVTWSFNPWEYENPPMVAGVEYRTTERYKGNPVYAKLVNFGAMPNTTSKSVSIGANLSLVSIEGMTYNGNYALPLSIHNGINSVYYNKSEGKLNVETKSDASKWSAEIVVKYTK